MPDTDLVSFFSFTINVDFDSRGFLEEAARRYNTHEDVSWEFDSDIGRFVFLDGAEKVKRNYTYKEVLASIGIDTDKMPIPKNRSLIITGV